MGSLWMKHVVFCKCFYECSRVKCCQGSTFVGLTSSHRPTYLFTTIQVCYVTLCRCLSLLRVETCCTKLYCLRYTSFSSVCVLSSVILSKLYVKFLFFPINYHNLWSYQ